MTRTIPIAACIVALPAMAAAEDETRLPEIAWRTEFVGQYAENGACDDPNAIWTLTEVAVDMGQISCVGVGKLTWEDDALVAPLSACTVDGNDHPEMRIAFQREQDGLTAVTATGEVSLRLCE